MDVASRRRSDGSRGGRDVLLQVELRRGHLRRNLRAALRSAIQEGRLTAGTRLPSSRRLAADLRVSRGVVSDAYDELAAECYLDTSPRQAPVVADVARAEPPPQAEPVKPTWAHDFIATTPDVDLFPRRPWLRACERVLRLMPNEALDYGDHRGRIELRLALSEYLARVRGVRVEPARMVVTQGFTQALDLLCRVLSARGATAMAFETPSLADEWLTVRAAGMQIEPVAVDGDGLRTDRLAELTAAAIVVTPAHQFPTGAVMAPARRAALVSWAGREDRLIVEDDYDAEFRYDRNAVGALQGIDPGRVIHIGTASKTLAPGVRLGWMSLPPDMVDEVRAAKAAADSGSPAIDQLALADLLASGAYDRVIARARHVYRRRRDRLLAALSRELRHPRVEGTDAGLHVLLRLPSGVDDVAVAAAAAQQGIGVRGLSTMSLTGSADGGLLLGYGRLPEERIDGAVTALASVIGQATSALYPGRTNG
jgi:GntR family transcriptional regulator/MocR family aminotransferase